MHHTTIKHLDGVLDSISHEISRVESYLRDETEPGPMAMLRSELAELRYDRILVQELIDDGVKGGVSEPALERVYCGLPGGIKGPEYDGDTND